MPKVFKSVQAEFEEYLETVFPKPMSDIQKNDLRMTFFAGAAIMFAMAECAPDLGEDEGVDFLEKIQAELEVTLFGFCKEAKKEVH